MTQIHKNLFVPKDISWCADSEDGSITASLKNPDFK